MEKILLVNACARPGSRTLNLAESVLNTIEGTVERIDLYKISLEPLDLAKMQKRDKAVSNKNFDDPYFDLAKQFAAADVIVIAAPYWDLMFPAVLKTYFENITICGITFDYALAHVRHGMCKAKALYYITTAGGFIGHNDFGFSYVKALAENFYLIPEVYRCAAEGLDREDVDVEEILQKAKDNLLTESQQKNISIPLQYGDRKSLGGAVAFDSALDHAHSRYYVANDFYNMQSDKSLHILSKFKTYQQTTEYTCGAASALMVLNWFGKEQYHENAIAQLLETHCTKGSSIENIADLFELLGWNVDYHASTDLRFKTIEEAEQAIISYIDRGIPMMIDWVDWAGHWQVLIGIDTCGTDSPYDDVLIFADPYDVTDHCQDGYYTYPLGRFFGMWREGPCAEKSTPCQQPFVAAWPQE